MISPYEGKHPSNMARVRQLMADGRWRTLEDIYRETGVPAASVSRYLRYFKEPRFGSLTVEKDATKKSAQHHYRVAV